MKGICRDNDTAGGDLIPTQDFVFVDGNLVIVDNDPVQGHGVGEHSGPTMIASTANVFINNIRVCKAGDLATCGHPATGSSTVLIGD